MSSDSRRQKSAEKSRKRRAEAARARQSRVRREGDALDGLNGEAGPAWASSGWADQGARVKAVFSRYDARGRAAAALITADLSTGELTAEVHAGWPREALDGQAGKFGGTETMVEVAPALVVRIAVEAVALGTRNGEEIPEIWPRLRALFGDVSPDDSPFEPTVGPVEAEPVRGPGLLGTLRRWLRLDQ